MLAGVLFSCIKQINAGEIGVKKLFGKVQKDVLGSGLHFINPLFQVEELDIKTQNYTMSGVHDEGTKTGDDAIRVLTADGLEVTIDLSVLYRLITDDAPMLPQETGSDYENKIVRPITRTRIRDNAVYYDAVALYSTKRDEFQQRIFKNIEADFKKRGLLLENLLVRNITLPQSVRTTIEQKINAEQDAQKMRARLEELQEALADTDQRVSPDPAIAARHSRIVADLTVERDLVQQRLKDAVAALETIRLNLLRLHAGTGTVQSLTTDLGLAREIASEIGRHVEGLREVEEAL